MVRSGFRTVSNDARHFIPFLRFYAHNTFMVSSDPSKVREDTSTSIRTEVEIEEVVEVVSIASVVSTKDEHLVVIHHAKRARSSWRKSSTCLHL